MRVKPRFVLNAATSALVLQRERLKMRIGVAVQNVADADYVYNFGNPFSGTHFGSSRAFSTKLAFEFK
jgi:hypothetical protein